MADGGEVSTTLELGSLKKNDHHGIFWDVVGKSEVEISQVWLQASRSPERVTLWTRLGGCQGHETKPGAWTQQAVGLVHPKQNTALRFTKVVQIAEGATCGFYAHTPDGGYVGLVANPAGKSNDHVVVRNRKLTTERTPFTSVKHNVQYLPAGALEVKSVVPQENMEARRTVESLRLELAQKQERVESLESELVDEKAAHAQEKAARVEEKAAYRRIVEERSQLAVHRPAETLSPSARVGVDGAEIEELEYKPLASFVDKPPPGELKQCSAYVLDCQGAMEGVKYLEESLREAGMVTRSKLASPDVKELLDARNITPAMLFAVVLYTFDLCMVDTTAARETNFYFVLNVMLRKRSPAFLRSAHGYLYYLMTGLERLPPFAGEHLFRGIDALGAPLARTNYKLGRECHWSSFSSATPLVKPAKEFAEQNGPGGIILRIRILAKVSRVRDIRRLSALSAEHEVLILPNFKTFVVSAVRFDASLGVDVIDLQEVDSNTHIF